MEASATRPEWLPIVRQCADQCGKTDGLPSLKASLGSGYWVCQTRERVDGTYRCNLYWVLLGPKRRYVKAGVFDTGKRSSLAKPRSTEFRRVRLADGNVVVVFWETVRGEPVPYPVPVEQTEVMRAT